MLEIVLKPLKSQRFTVSLNNQACEIRLAQRTTGLYIDLTVNGTPCLQVLCLNGNKDRALRLSAIRRRIIFR